MRTKAEFRALREMAGLSQADLADEMGIRVRAVKRWEAPDSGYDHIPDEAWEILENDIKDQRQKVGDMLRRMDEAGEKSCTLTYFRSQEEHDQCSEEDEWFGAANARSRLLAQILMLQGRSAAFRYPEDE